MKNIIHQNNKHRMRSTKNSMLIFRYHKNDFFLRNAEMNRLYNQGRYNLHLLAYQNVNLSWRKFLNENYTCQKTIDDDIVEM